CYVGITRARERLYLLNAWSRSLWGGLNYNPASRFLSEIPNELVTLAHESRASGKHGRQLVERDASGFRIGQEVEHDRWGRGTILEIARSGVGLEATVNFPTVGEKRLDLTLAPLKPL
ncbi:MAG: ATP-dependent helicase UvrD/PcrA, partial [Actinomycetota bacterium]|nr:ATP-dependent helicase UvrD/PcrA [Actinomycetota bacterium]